VKEKEITLQAQRVGKVANLVIFIGIMGIVLSILALTISDSLAKRGYGYMYISFGILMVILGYGVRYRYKHCLFVALVLFLYLSCNFLFRFFAHHTAYIFLRFLLSTWVSFRIFQSIPSMQLLIKANIYPDRTNRFTSFLSRQKNHDNFE